MNLIKKIVHFQKKKRNELRFMEFGFEIESKKKIIWKNFTNSSEL